jgi:hypothetical protein
MLPAARVWLTCWWAVCGLRRFPFHSQPALPFLQVRKNTLMVLTHLILNDMMKASCLPALLPSCPPLAAFLPAPCCRRRSFVLLRKSSAAPPAPDTHATAPTHPQVKGHIAKMAVCLEDGDERISALAQLFFHELAKKEYKVRVGVSVRRMGVKGCNHCCLQASIGCNRRGRGGLQRRAEPN